MMDSQVLRLIRRYDPVGSNTTGTITPRRSLESTRGVWHTVAPQLPPESPPYLSRRSLTTTYEDEIPTKQPSTPRLQRQQAIYEQEPPLTNSIRPILKYASPTSRTEFIVQPHRTEPLTIEIDPHVSLSNENAAIYQPLITTGTKRVCAALSKSEWDLRIQNETSPIIPPLPFPVRPPSPPQETINQQQERESYRPILSRSKSSTIINHTNDDDIDDFDEISAPIIGSSRSCVEKLKQLFSTKSSVDLTNYDQVDSNVSPAIVKPILEPPQRKQINENLNKPTTIVQDVTPTFPLFNRQPVLISQKTIDRYKRFFLLYFNK
jgi:hypothetical protein